MCAITPTAHLRPDLTLRYFAVFIFLLITVYLSGASLAELTAVLASASTFATRDSFH
jgi:hypothetical protein